MRKQPDQTTCATAGIDQANQDEGSCWKLLHGQVSRPTFNALRGQTVGKHAASSVVRRWRKKPDTVPFLNTKRIPQTEFRTRSNDYRHESGATQHSPRASSTQAAIVQIELQLELVSESLSTGTPIFEPTLALATHSSSPCTLHISTASQNYRLTRVEATNAGPAAHA